MKIGEVDMKETRVSEIQCDPKIQLNYVFGPQNEKKIVCKHVNTIYSRTGKSR